MARSIKQEFREAQASRRRPVHNPRLTREHRGAAITDQHLTTNSFGFPASLALRSLGCLLDIMLTMPSLS